MVLGFLRAVIGLDPLLGQLERLQNAGIAGSRGAIDLGLAHLQPVGVESRRETFLHDPERLEQPRLLLEHGALDVGGGEPVREKQSVAAPSVPDADGNPRERHGSAGAPRGRREERHQVGPGALEGDGER